MKLPICAFYPRFSPPRAPLPWGQEAVFGRPRPPSAPPRARRRLRRGGRSPLHPRGTTHASDCARARVTRAGGDSAARFEGAWGRADLCGGRPSSPVRPDGLGTGSSRAGSHPCVRHARRTRHIALKIYWSGRRGSRRRVRRAVGAPHLRADHDAFAARPHILATGSHVAGGHTCVQRGHCDVKIGTILIIEVNRSYGRALEQRPGGAGGRVVIRSSSRLRYFRAGIDPRGQKKHVGSCPQANRAC